MDRLRNFIDGAWVPPDGGEHYTTHNPAHPRQAVRECPRSGRVDVTAAVAAAEAARAEWADTPGPQRGALLGRFAQLLEDSGQDLGRVITLEMGKSLSEAVGEVARAAAEARFMAGEASRPVGETYPSERAGFSCHTVREPVGVIASITPWNFPVVSPVRKIAPALAYGNTVVCKPATDTPWCTAFIVALLEKAGLPKGVVNLVVGPGAAVGEALVGDLRVSGVTFTGSTAVGARIYETAARRLARVQLELGGKNPALVLDCGDFDGAAREITGAAFLCSGQRCTALSRVIVLEAQADAMVECLLAHIRRIRVGDGLAEGTTMGPLASLGQYRTVEAYVRQGLESGAVLVTGGRSRVEDPEREGFYFEPTLFDRVDPESPLAREEIFGPVLPVIRVADLEEAIRVANHTRYGLAASVFSSQPRVMQECARRIEAGMIHLNHGTASQAHVPFGGRKDSGQGAFSIGPTAQEFFTVVKAIYAKW
jgi:aldehyde dehydrogenase (NAD+)